MSEQPFKPTVQLTGLDGNVFFIISQVSKALNAAGQHDEMADFQKAAFDAQSYDEVLRLAMDYCEVY